MVIEELRNFHRIPKRAVADDYVAERTQAHETYIKERSAQPQPRPNAKRGPMPEAHALLPAPRPPRARPSALTKRDYVDRRGVSLLDAKPRRDRRRRAADRRRQRYAITFPDRRLTRSAYEQVFLKLVSGGRLRVNGDLYTPVGMKGWYHAIFRNTAGEERLLTIDQLLKKMNDWV
jgi:hypothetical protein